MKYIIFTFSLLFVVSCSILKNSYKVKKDQRVINYANTITAAELKQHLSVIASDEYEGRETGKKGQRMTAEYLKNEFIKAGVLPGNNGDYFQNFPLNETSKPEAYFKINGKKFEFLKDFYFYKDYADIKSFSSETKEIIDVENGIVQGTRNDYANKLVKGKVVSIMLESPKQFKNWDWRKKVELAMENGATRVIFTSNNFKNNIERLSHFLGKTSLKLVNNKSEKEKFIPFFFVSDDMLIEFNNLQSDNNLNFYYKSSTRTINSSNVLGFIEGSDPVLKNEIVILTAHYDHLGVIDGLVYNGADDDGTGTVALLEIAEAFQTAKNEGNGPKRSILIMPVSGEEKGLLGSQFYAANPVYPIANTVVDLNIDMIGRMDENHTDSNYVYIIGADKISQELHDVNEAVNKTYTKLDLDYTFNDDADPNRFYYRSDHYSFAKKGIPVIFYFSGVHEDYHKHTDEIDKIMFKKVEKITKLVFYTAWEIANKPNRLIISQ